MLVIVRITGSLTVDQRLATCNFWPYETYRSVLHANCTTCFGLETYYFVVVRLHGVVQIVARHDVELTLTHR